MTNVMRNLRAVHLASLFAMALAIAVTHGAVGATEVCHYAGDADYSGKIDIQTTAVSTGVDLKSVSHVQVTMRFQASAFFQKIDYRIDEVSEWNHGVLQEVAVNTRYLLNGNVNKQMWDHFEPDHGAFAGYRIQGKKIEDVSRFGIFSKFWDPSLFSNPWISDFKKSNPERRPDLDLAAFDLVPQLKTPMALGLYFVRYFSPTAQTAPIFLAGEKHQKRLDLSLAIPTVDDDGTIHWAVPLHFGQIQTRDDNPAEIAIFANHVLQKLDFTIDQPLGSAHGLITLVGCTR